MPSLEFLSSGLVWAFVHIRSGDVFVLGADNGVAAFDTYGVAGTSFVSRYSSSGGRIWTVKDNTSVTINDIKADSAGNLYAIHSQGILYQKFNSSGSVVSTVQDSAGGGNALPTGIALDTSGNVFITGTSPNMFGDLTLFTKKYGPDGTQVWSSPK